MPCVMLVPGKVLVTPLQWPSWPAGTFPSPALPGECIPGELYSSIIKRRRSGSADVLGCSIKTCEDGQMNDKLTYLSVVPTGLGCDKSRLCR